MNQSHFKNVEGKSVEEPILIWNRREGREEVEQVYGAGPLNWVYGTQPGQALADGVLSGKFLSQAYGWYQSSSWSGHKVMPFIEEFKIPMQEYEDGPFKSFNDFFIRKFKPGVRPFASDLKAFPAFAEARYLAFSKITREQTFPVKGQFLSAEGLLGDSEKAKKFENGPLLLARLCPIDYHRFHFPDAGKVVDQYTVGGRLHSVNPKALKYKEDIFITNERQVSLLETQNFGTLAYIEVGALCVGKIVQSYQDNEFQRGDEKGYFLFGGSTVIVLGQPGAWKPDEDLLRQTARGRETLVRLGEKVGE